MQAKELIAYFEKLKSDRASFDSIWQDIATYIMPRKAAIESRFSPGRKLTTYLFDNTAIDSNIDLAAWLDSNLTSMAMEWFSLRVGPQGSTTTDKTLEIWLEDCKSKQYDALRASNFSMEINEVYLDLGAFGIAGMFLDEAPIEGGRFGGLQFDALFPGRFVIDEGPDGKVCCLIRELELTAQAAYQKWGEKLDSKILAAREKDPNQKFPFLHGVMPSKWFTDKKQRFPQYSLYVDVTGKKKVQEGGFHEFPFFVPRWSKSTDEKYGRGPGDTALPNVRTLNKAVELGLKAWAKAIDPPMKQVDDGVIGAVRINPGGITTVRNKDSLTALETGARFDVSQVNCENLQASIRKTFYNDKIQYLPPADQTGKMTAYEVARRYELMQRLLGPTFGHITSELLDPLIERAFNIMFRAKVFGPPPANLGREPINIEYEGPLAKAQRSQQVDAISNTFAIVGPMMEFYPDIKDNFDADEAAVSVAKIQGVPKAIIRSKEQVQKIRQQRAEAAKAEQQQQQALTMAETAQKGIPALKELGPGGVDTLAKAAGQAGL